MRRPLRQFKFTEQRAIAKMARFWSPAFCARQFEPRRLTEAERARAQWKALFRRVEA